MSKKLFTCPVCGFDGLEESPVRGQDALSYEICPCCGFEFGFDAASFDEYRRQWVEGGAKWFIPTLKPENWNLEKQLSNLKQ